MASPASSSSSSDDLLIYKQIFNTSSPALPASTTSSADSFTYNNPNFSTVYTYSNYLNNIPSLNTITRSIPLTYYQDLNLEIDVQHRMIKYYKKKLKKWLKSDLKDLVAKVKMGDNDVLKINHIMKKIMNKYEIEATLTVYINKTGSSWITLTKNNEFIKELFRYKIEKKLNKQ